MHEDLNWVNLTFKGDTSNRRNSFRTFIKKKHTHLCTGAPFSSSVINSNLLGPFLKNKNIQK